MTSLYYNAGFHTRKSQHLMPYYVLPISKIYDYIVSYQDNDNQPWTVGWTEAGKKKKKKAALVNYDEYFCCFSYIFVLINCKSKRCIDRENNLLLQ